MYTRVVVPFSGGEFSAGAIAVARAVARAAISPLHVVSFAMTSAHAHDLEAAIRTETETITDVPVVTAVEQVDEIVGALARTVADDPGTLLCMRSVGRSHAEPVLGSFAESVLREIYGPMLLVGPHAATSEYALSGDMVVCTDGSATARAMEPIASQWAIAFHLTPWLITVNPATGSQTADDPASEIIHLAHEAHVMQRDIGPTVQYDVLHAKNVPGAIVDFARERNAAVISMATHGVTGLRRIALGSVTMSVVHKAPCPVLVHRPPHLPHE